MASPRPPVSSSTAAPTLPYVVRTQLATIRGQAQLAARQARQLPDPERLLLLARLQAIEGAVLQLVAQLAPWEGTAHRGD